MAVLWDKTDDRLWFGTWDDPVTELRLHLVAERMPRSTRWDWTVWEADQPGIVRRGIARSASAAAIAAAAAAANTAIACSPTVH